MWDALPQQKVEREVDVIHTSTGVRVRHVVALVLEERDQADRPHLGQLFEAHRGFLTGLVAGPRDLEVKVQKGSIGAAEWTFESIRVGGDEVGVELSSKKVASLLAKDKVSLADLAFG